MLDYYDIELPLMSTAEYKRGYTRGFLWPIIVFALPKAALYSMNAVRSGGILNTWCQSGSGYSLGTLSVIIGKGLVGVVGDTRSSRTR
jgi:hypothetical protein